MGEHSRGRFGKGAKRIQSLLKAALAIKARKVQGPARFLLVEKTCWGKCLGFVPCRGLSRDIVPFVTLWIWNLVAVAVGFLLSVQFAGNCSSLSPLGSLPFVPPLGGAVFRGRTHMWAPVIGGLSAPQFPPSVTA